MLYLNLPPSKTNYAQIIHSAEFRSAINFYGYHEKESLYITIKFKDPYFIKVAAEIMYVNKICNTYFQPCESHLSYDLKFLIDCNLRGMDFAKFKHSIDITANNAYAKKVFL